MKPRVWCTQFITCSLVDVRSTSNFFLLLFKTIKITANNPLLSIYFLPSKLHIFCYLLLEIFLKCFWSSFDFPDTLRFSPYNCYIYSIYFCFKTLIKILSMLFFLDIIILLKHTMDEKVKSKEQKLTRNEQKLTNSDQQVKSSVSIKFM